MLDVCDSRCFGSRCSPSRISTLSLFRLHSPFQVQPTSRVPHALTESTITGCAILPAVTVNFTLPTTRISSRPLLSPSKLVRYSHQSLEHEVLHGPGITTSTPDHLLHLSLNPRQSKPFSTPFSFPNFLPLPHCALLHFPTPTDLSRIPFALSLIVIIIIIAQPEPTSV